jgi:hypothetical protein
MEASAVTQRGKHKNSLENLKMGAIARKQGKKRVNVTLLPQTLQWLDKSGNRSEMIDEIVRRILKGDLIPKKYG